MSRVGSLVAAGRTSDVYEFGRGAVLKVPRPGVPAHWAAEEASFTAAVREIGAPAPEVVDVIEVDGRDAIVFERVHGPSMWEAIVERPSDVGVLGRELAEVHQRILFAGLPRALVGMVERMSIKIEAVGQLDDAERTEALDTLDRLPCGAALLHGDLHPGNVLMSPSGPVAIDWFDTAIGHPVADVVRSSLLIRPLDDSARRPHLPGARPDLLSELHKAYVTAMHQVLSRPVDELRQWEALVAASRLAEDAEADQSLLVDLWRDRKRDWRSPLADAASDRGADERTD